MHMGIMILSQFDLKALKRHFMTWAPVSSKVYFTVHLIHQDCNTWMGIQGVMIM